MMTTGDIFVGLLYLAIFLGSVVVVLIWLHGVEQKPKDLKKELDDLKKVVESQRQVLEQLRRELDELKRR